MIDDVRPRTPTGMPAKAVDTLMKLLSEKHSKTSKNFWN